jgi:hypothetical protein
MAPLPEYRESQSVVALNDTVDLVRLLTEGSLFRVLNQSRTLAASCGTDCTCNDSMCTCRHSRVAAEMERMSPSELESLRIERIEELRRQLGEVERQLAETRADSPQGQQLPQQGTQGQQSPQQGTQGQQYPPQGQQLPPQAP